MKYLVHVLSSYASISFSVILFVVILWLYEQLTDDDDK